MTEYWIDKKLNFYDLNNSIIKIKNNEIIEDDFFKYALNFNRAAHILAEYTLNSNNIAKLDINFFALAYLYRHSIELLLKAIAFKYIKDCKTRKAFIKDTFHNLENILEYINPYIIESFKLNANEYKWMKEFFNSINEIDKESDCFRYPFNIKIEKNKKYFYIKSFFKKQTHINLLNFINKFEIVFEILKKCYLEEDIYIKEYKEYSSDFIEEGGYYYAQSVLGYSYNNEEFFPYVKSYRDCAKYLYKYMNSNCNYELFIPMCYLYRNSIELAMKEILFEQCDYDYQKKLKRVNRSKHSLIKLWHLIKDDIKKHSRTTNDYNVIKNIENYIKELHDIDNSADKFRYPINKNLELHFENIKKFDVENVKIFYEILVDYFYTICRMMSYTNEVNAEMEMDARQY